MGCGVSSTYANDSSVVDTSNNIINNRMQPQNSIEINQTDKQLIDKRNAIRIFNNLESAIQTMEESKCFEKHRILSEDIEQLREQFQRLTEIANQINNKILNESNKMSVSPNLQELVVSILMNSNSNSNNPNLVELLNRLEINEIKLELVQKDINNLNTEIKELKIICDQLQELYQQRDNVLNQVFGGHYGNEKESQLEKDLDSLLEEQHYIEVAKIRWIHSDNLIVDALNCLDISIDKIQQFNDTTDNDLNFKYTCILEARNNLILYHYNLMSVQNILQNVKLPHCTIEDLDEVDQLIVDLFVDITTNQEKKLLQNLEFIQSMRTKTVTQHKWIKEVLNSTIKNDLLDVREKCRSKMHELRFERTILIKHKMEEWQMNEDVVKQDSPFDLRVDSGVDSELDESVVADEQLARIFASGKDSITSPEMSNATPLLPGEELGPIPTNKEVFGKIVELRNKHTKEMQEFEQNQKMNRVRMSQGLQDKLNARRSRRSRMEMHRRELEALQESPVN